MTMPLDMHKSLLLLPCPGMCGVQICPQLCSSRHSWQQLREQRILT